MEPSGTCTRCAWPRKLAVDLRDDLANGLGGTGRMRDRVDCGGAQCTAALVATRAVQNHLGAGVGVDRGHEAGLDAPLVVEQLDHCSHRVGGAGAGGHDVVVLLQNVVVDTEDDGRGGLVLGRSGDEHLLGAGVQMV